MGDPWFKFFPADWVSGVSGLSAAERGVYVTLLALMYDHAAPIKRDDARLARQCGLPKFGFVRALESLIDGGKITFDGGLLFNERAKTQLSERENRSLSASENAHSRWDKNKQNQSSSNASAKRPQCETHATRARVPEARVNSSLRSELNAREEADFEAFWDEWPNKVGKPAARKAYAAARKRGATAGQIITGLLAYVRTKPADRPWLNPATFLNQERWNDAPAAVSRAGPSSAGPRPSGKETVTQIALGNFFDDQPYDAPQNFSRSDARAAGTGGHGIPLLQSGPQVPEWEIHDLPRRRAVSE